MRNTVISRRATDWNSHQLAEILTRCFEGYLVPFKLDGLTFAARFASEDISLNDSVVWLLEDEPVAIALICRRGRSSRLGAFAIKPALRGQGYGRVFIQQLIDAACERRDGQMWLEVIVGNDAGLALYERMGFVRQQTLVGFQAGGSVRQGETGELHEADALGVARRMLSDMRQPLPWLNAPETIYKLGGQALMLENVASAVVVPALHQPKLRALHVVPTAQGKGYARKLLTLLHDRFPGLSTVVAIPEQMSPLFLSSGYVKQPVSQYAMLLRL